MVVLTDLFLYPKAISRQEIDGGGHIPDDVAIARRKAAGIALGNVPEIRHEQSEIRRDAVGQDVLLEFGTRGREFFQYRNYGYGLSESVVYAILFEHECVGSKIDNVFHVTFPLGEVLLFYT